MHIRDKASRVPIDVGNLKSGKTEAFLSFMVHPLGRSTGGGGGGHGSRPLHLENHVAIGLEKLVQTPIEGGSYGPL